MGVRTEVFGTDERGIQGRGTFGAKFTMENENRLPGSISAAGWLRLERVGTKKKLFNGSGRINVEGAGNMSTAVLVIKPTVDDVV